MGRPAALRADAEDRFTFTITNRLFDRLEHKPVKASPGGQQRDAAYVVPPSQHEQQRTLLKSARHGAYLLKNEEEELQKVAAYARELHAHEYRAPQRPIPCGAEKAACLACYKQNAAEPLACGAAVAAYEGCTRRATEARARVNESRAGDCSSQ